MKSFPRNRKKSQKIRIEKPSSPEFKFQSIHNLDELGAELTAGEGVKGTEPH